MEKKKEKRIQVTFVIEEKAVKLIDYYAEKVDRSRSQMIRNLVLMSLDDAKIMNSMGVFDIIKVANWFLRGRQKALPIQQD